MNSFSASGEWTRRISASPRFPSAMACPDPTAMVFTVMLLLFSKRGMRTSRRPVSWVLVVVARMRSLLFAQADDRTSAADRAIMIRRVMVCIASSIEGEGAG